MDNFLSSAFFEFISPAEPVSRAGRERFESEHFSAFARFEHGELQRRHEQIRKKSVSRALALSTAIFVVSGASKAPSTRLDYQAKMADSAGRSQAADGEALSFDASGTIYRQGRDALRLFGRSERLFAMRIARRETGIEELRPRPNMAPEKGNERSIAA